ncbi:MAG TPA: decarboxylating 6-phosphogluconate dehydrogenase [Candidatus Paceibacterota bacterium]|nr:decarboxylating 6-phosphogluconate dehydrogenase [Candidatus Paceibacterota bacterium]HMP18907.1 decarboxylating 6-phosphogluconate dehydrogenase [Candidatus Paceibacterota bacterium]
MKIGYIGLGKMGFNMVSRMLKHKHTVVVYNRSNPSVKKAQKKGAIPANSISELVLKLEKPRTIWMMVPWKSVDSVLEEILKFAEAGDTIIDGGNSPYYESVRRAKMLSEKKINFLDIGVSGGPGGALNGACLMIGGEKKVYKKYERLFKDLSVPSGYCHFGKNGSGHFVKMVHNGIEYGMMQSIAEGFNLMKNSEFELDLLKIASLYNHGSVVESKLIGWLSNAYKKHKIDLKNISGEVSHSGEGLWTVLAAKKMGVSVKIIEESLKFREKSKNNPSYTGKVVSAMRGEFGGHDVSDKINKN